MQGAASDTEVLGHFGARKNLAEQRSVGFEGQHAIPLS
jgi:hypothetical protein